MNAPRDRDLDPARFLPLTTVALELLLSLAGEPLHGYAILKDIEERTGGTARPNAGTLYRAIARLVDSGLVEERGEHEVGASEDGRRRYYALTPMGRAVLTAEASRLERTVSAARARKVLPAKGLA